MFQMTQWYILHGHVATIIKQTVTSLNKLDHQKIILDKCKKINKYITITAFY